jgi:hypothetical protein
MKTEIPLQDTRYYLLVGDEDTWKISLKKNLWGFTQKTKGLWNTSNVEDFVCFYVTSPVKKIIGFGKIKNKFTGSDLVWKDEKLFERPLWNYRMNFDVLHLVNDWNDGIKSPEGIMLNAGRIVIKKDIFLKLIKTAEKQWETSIKIQEAIKLF